MSIYDKASLIQIPSGYRAGNLYSVIPNSGAGDFTHTRNGTATRVNSQGLIETVNANVPRLDYPFIDGVVQDCPHLLLEPQRTNYALNSNDASQWSNVGGSQSITKTANYATAPDGSLTATRLQATATGSNYSLISISTTSFTGDYSGSVYLKSNTGNTENVIVYGRNTSVTSYPIGNEWQRIEIQGSGTSGQNLYLYLGSFPNNGSDESIDILVWGGQIEQGSYPTSYTQTGASTVTRLKDECTNGGNADLFNVTEGTLFLDFEAFTPEDNSGRLLSLSDQSDNNRLLLIPYTNNQLRVIVQANGSLDVSAYGAISYNTRQKAAVSYELNSVKIYINGTLVFTDTSVGTFSNLTKISFADVDNNPTATARIYELIYFDSVISQSDLETLTTL